MKLDQNKIFYYINRNEMISVKEFMYRLNTLYIKKKFDE